MLTEPRVPQDIVSPPGMVTGCERSFLSSTACKAAGTAAGCAVPATLALMAWRVASPAADLPGGGLKADITGNASATAAATIKECRRIASPLALAAGAIPADQAKRATADATAPAGTRINWLT